MRTGTILIMLALAGCGGSAAGGSGGRTEVVAGFYPLAYAAEEIGGDGVEVANLTPPGAEPHDLELSPRDVARVRDADLVLYLGGGFQPALEDAVEGANGLDLLAGLDLLPGGDPHVWLDPLRYAELAGRIGRELGRESAAFAFVRRLEELDAEYRSALAGCERRELVTSHAAFGYLAARYRLEQIPIAGLSPEAEPPPRELERVARLVREQGITTVFYETLVSPDVARTVAREAGAETAVLDPLEGLAEDAQDADYFTVMRTNLETLVEALGCR